VRMRPGSRTRYFVVVRYLSRVRRSNCVEKPGEWRVGKPLRRSEVLTQNCSSTTVATRRTTWYRQLKSAGSPWQPRAIPLLGAEQADEEETRDFTLDPNAGTKPYEKRRARWRATGTGTKYSRAGPSRG